MEYIIFSIALLAVFNIKWVIFLVTLIPIRIVNIYLVAKEEKIILGKEQEKPSSMGHRTKRILRIERKEYQTY